MNLSSVDLNLLTALEALLEEGSVTRASERVGLSPSAMSHALARLREQLDDPILVRAGRAMVLTERAAELRPRVQALMAETRSVLSPARGFDPAELERGFRIHATDHVLAVLGQGLDQAARAQAPRVVLSYLPNRPDDGELLREGNIDLAIGVFPQLPPELLMQRLFKDRFVCVVRAKHPMIKRTLDAKTYTSLEHVQIAPRGRPGSIVDDILATHGLQRRVARTVPYFTSGLMMVAETDYILTVSARMARALAPTFGLRVLEPPVPIPSYTLSQIWHPRVDADPAHRWLRRVMVQVAHEVAPDDTL